MKILFSKKIYAFGLMFIVMACATPPIEKPARPALRFDHVWQGIQKVTFVYPIQDYSVEEGYVESDWILLNPQIRYRFFIHASREHPGEFSVDIEQQKRTSQKSHWISNATYLNLEENIKNAIRHEIQAEMENPS